MADYLSINVLKEELKEKMDKRTYDTWEQNNFDLAYRFSYIWGEEQSLVAWPLLHLFIDSGCKKEVAVLLMCGKYIQGHYVPSGLDIIDSARKKGIAAFLKDEKRIQVDPHLLPILHTAAGAGNLEVLRMLLEEEEIDINLAANGNKVTALHVAAREGKSESIKVLLKYGAKTELQSVNGATALHYALIYAIKHRNMDVAKLLVDQEVDIHAKILYEFTVNNIVIAEGSSSSIRTENDEFNVLSLAVFSGDFKLVKILIEKYPDINTTTQKFKFTPLHMAFISPHYNKEIVKLLIHKNADSIALTSGGRSALSLAIVNRNLEEAKLVLESLWEEVVILFCCWSKKILKEFGKNDLDYTRAVLETFSMLANDNKDHWHEKNRNKSTDFVSVLEEGILKARINSQNHIVELLKNFLILLKFNNYIYEEHRALEGQIAEKTSQNKRKAPRESQKVISNAHKTNELVDEVERELHVVDHNNEKEIEVFNEVGLVEEFYNKVVPENFQRFDTAGAGNCFFHAAFGDMKRTEDGREEYKAENAHEMRKEFHRVLNQFESLQDEGMPVYFKNTIKNMFSELIDSCACKINSVEKYTGLDLIHGYITEEIKKKNIGNGPILKKKKEEIAESCIKKILIHQGNFYREYEEFKKNCDDKNVIKTQEEFFNQGNNYKELKEELNRNYQKYSCMFVDAESKKNLDNLIKESQEEKDNFINSQKLYRKYLDSIQYNSHYINDNEIAIIATLSGVTINVYVRSQGVFLDKIKPDLQCNIQYETIWTSKKKALSIWGSDKKDRYISSDVTTHYEKLVRTKEESYIKYPSILNEPSRMHSTKNSFFSSDDSIAYHTTESLMQTGNIVEESIEKVNIFSINTLPSARGILTKQLDNGSGKKKVRWAKGVIDNGILDNEFITQNAQANVESLPAGYVEGKVVGDLCKIVSQGLKRIEMRNIAPSEVHRKCMDYVNRVGGKCLNKVKKMKIDDKFHKELMSLREINTLHGRLSIEGRILCIVYGIKLYVFTKQEKTEKKATWISEVVDATGSRPDKINYEDENGLYLINEGNERFKLILKQTKQENKKPISSADLEMMLLSADSEKKLDTFFRKFSQTLLRNNQDEYVNNPGPGYRFYGIDDQTNKSVDTTLFHAASFKRCTGVLEKLIKARGTSVDLENSDRDTALHIAVRINDPKMVKILIENRANPALKNKLGETPSNLALGKNNKEIMNILETEITNNLEKATKNKLAFPGSKKRTLAIENNENGLMSPIKKGKTNTRMFGPRA